VAGGLDGGITGAKAGAAVGAAVGSAVPVLGTVIGGGVGAVVGFVGGITNSFSKVSGIKTAEDLFNALGGSKFSKALKESFKISEQEWKFMKANKDESIIALAVTTGLPLKKDPIGYQTRIIEKYKPNGENVYNGLTRVSKLQDYLNAGKSYIDKATTIVDKGKQFVTDVKAGYDIVSKSANDLQNIKNVKSDGALVTNTSQPGGGGWIVLVAIAAVAYFLFKR